MANFKRIKYTCTTNTQNNVNLSWGLWSRQGGGGGGTGFSLALVPRSREQRASSYAMLRHAIIVQVRLDSSQMAPTLIAWV